MSNLTVVMAVYNGSKYLQFQIDSILREISSKDLLLIYDDFSGEETKKLLERYQTNKNVKIIFGNKNIGPNASFKKLVDLVQTKKLIFCDQDDIWLKGRTKLIKKTDSKSLVIVNFFFLKNNTKTKSDINKINLFNTFIKNKVPGCSIGGDTEIIKSLFTEVPNTLLYDQVILFKAVLRKINIFIDVEPRFLYRRHENTFTKNGLAKDGYLLSLKRRFDLFSLIFSKEK